MKCNRRFRGLFLQKGNQDLGLFPLDYNFQKQRSATMKGFPFEYNLCLKVSFGINKRHLMQFMLVQLLQQ